MNIRNASLETDLPRIADLLRPYETNPSTPAQIRAHFEHNPPGRIQIRMVAVDEQDVVTAYSGAIHEAAAPAGFFVVWDIVDPARRGQGIGSSLWSATLERARQQGASSMETDIPEGDSVALAFAERRGFVIDRHLFHSSLDLAAFDETPYLPGIAELEASGIRFCSLADIPDTPETRRKLYHLNYQYDREILHVVPGFAEFDRFVCEAPWFVRAGQLLAVEGDTWAGLAAVSINTETKSAYNENTVVLPSHRGRKIARALKVQAARYARRNSMLTLETDNNSKNAPILAINRRMGYQPQPGKYWLVCQIEEEKNTK